MLITCPSDEIEHYSPEHYCYQTDVSVYITTQVLVLLNMYLSHHSDIRLIIQLLVPQMSATTDVLVSSSIINKDQRYQPGVIIKDQVLLPRCHYQRLGVAN
ncbi:hypothetical protein LSH36_651g00016 [Paralvinella palmiformis]|uniref:Uncharacterized protein n=1 Tax=Paralvinella palmiformis TaxID=53620 RepID=A0AAD9MWR2_9ANNE|nr:hypothetical protein LSH36_651g00016 [Paralvinella palmiformis]